MGVEVRDVSVVLVAPELPPVELALVVELVDPEAAVVSARGGAGVGLGEFVP
ncbi:MAG: hypothetical protein AAFV29_09655 [Myxococcota bacterium]